MVKNLNKITHFIILTVLPVIIFAQDYRVKSVKHIIQNHTKFGQTDTIRKDFFYHDSILEEIRITKTRLSYSNSFVKKVHYTPGKYEPALKHLNSIHSTGLQNTFQTDFIIILNTTIKTGPLCWCGILTH